MCDKPMRFRQGAIAAGGPITVDVRSAVVPLREMHRLLDTPLYALLAITRYVCGIQEELKIGALPQHAHPRLLAGGLSSILDARSPGFNRVTEHWLGYLGCGQLSSRN
jgi:hypothetical protein